MFSVHSIGWVVTRDLFGEFFRKRFGLTARIDGAAIGSAVRRWEALSASVSDDRRAAGFVACLLHPRRLPLSARSEAALRAFVEDLVAAAPGLYTRPALRERCLSRCINFLGSSLICIVLGHHSSPDSPTIAAAMLSFFSIAGWSLATAAQLFNALRVVDSLGRKPGRAPRPA